MDVFRIAGADRLSLDGWGLPWPRTRAVGHLRRLAGYEVGKVGND